MSASLQYCRRVARFLTAAWVSELNTAAERLGPIGGPGKVVIAIEVPPVSAYHVVIGTEGVHAAAGVPPDADLVLTCDEPTARALAQNTTNAQQTLMDGRLQIRGSIDRLASLRDALTVLGDVFAAVRASTDFTAEP